LTEASLGRRINALRLDPALGQIRRVLASGGSVLTHGAIIICRSAEPDSTNFAHVSIPQTKVYRHSDDLQAIFCTVPYTAFICRDISIQPRSCECFTSLAIKLTSIKSRFSPHGRPPSEEHSGAAETSRVSEAVNVRRPAAVAGAARRRAGVPWGLTASSMSAASALPAIASLQFSPKLHQQVHPGQHRDHAHGDGGYLLEYLAIRAGIPCHVLGLPGEIERVVGAGHAPRMLRRSSDEVKKSSTASRYPSL